MLDVLFWGLKALGISKLQFLIKKKDLKKMFQPYFFIFVFSFLSSKPWISGSGLDLYLDPDSLEMLDTDPYLDPDSINPDLQLRFNVTKPKSFQIQYSSMLYRKILTKIKIYLQLVLDNWGRKTISAYNLKTYIRVWQSRSGLHGIAFICWQNVHAFPS